MLVIGRTSAEFHGFIRLDTQILKVCISVVKKLQWATYDCQTLVGSHVGDSRCIQSSMMIPNVLLDLTLGDLERPHSKSLSF